MSAGRVVPVAYVTKYAETRGIIIVRGARTNEEGRYLVAHHMFVSPNDWTEDLPTAEERYRNSLRRALKSAEKRAKDIRAKLDAAPAYEESVCGKERHHVVHGLSGRCSFVPYHPGKCSWEAKP